MNKSKWMIAGTIGCSATIAFGLLTIGSLYHGDYCYSLVFSLLSIIGGLVLYISAEKV